MENNLKILDAGKTKFVCGCWIEMNYSRTFPVVNGDVCDDHNISNNEVETPNAYKVFWLFLRNRIRRYHVIHEGPERQKTKKYPTDVITEHEGTFNALDVVLNFDINDFK